MNRLRLMLVGAALITGGSALASAQVVQQDVAFREHDRDRDDRRVYRDRDDRGYYGGYDHDRRDDGYNRRWDGRRWVYWNGRNWIY